MFFHLQELTEKRSAGQPQLNVVLIGGSFLALESVCYFVEKQAQTLIVCRQQPLARRLGAAAAAKLAQLHASKGVSFAVEPRMDVAAFRHSGQGALTAVQVASGQVYACDLCVVCVGGEPCTEFLGREGRGK